MFSREEITCRAPHHLALALGGFAPYFDLQRALPMRFGVLIPLFSLAACTPAAVPASALKVRLVVTPSVVSKSADSAHVEVRVRVTNPRWRPVIVDLGPPPAAGEDPPRNSKFSAAWTIEAITPGTGCGGKRSGMWGQRVFRFGPRSTGSAVFHLPINSAPHPAWERIEDIPPGEYRITGSFGTQPAPRSPHCASVMPARRSRPTLAEIT